MTLDELVAYCFAKLGAWRDESWKGGTFAKVCAKKLAFLGGGNCVGLKCGWSPDEADEWLRRYPDAATVMAYLGRYGWNTLTVGGAVSDEEILGASRRVVPRGRGGAAPKSNRP